jgi:ABC-type spermidine/putrescine transport system permease subunit I
MRDFVAAGWLVCALLAFYLAYWADTQRRRMRSRASGWRSTR